MTTRILPREEWAKLTGTDLETVWPHFGEDVQIVVVEDDAQIVGCWAAIPLVHVEGLWIAPAYRGRVSVGRRLWLGMQQFLRERGIPRVLTTACADDVRRILARVSARALPGDHYVIPIGEHESCP